MRDHLIKIENMSKKTQEKVGEGLKDVEEGRYKTYSSVSEFFEEFDRKWENRTRWQKFKDFLYYRMWRRMIDIPSDILWWFKWRVIPRHRYNYLQTGLEPGYYDPSYSLPLGLFYTTEMFIEGTKDVVDWDGTEDHQEAWKAFTEAVQWYHDNRKELGGEGDLEKREDETYQECWKRELAWRDERNEHLSNIIRYIDFMWYP